MVLKKTDRLTNEPGVHGVAQIGNRGVTYVLNLRGAQVFGDRFDTENHEEGEGENGLDVVKAGGKEGIQVNDVIGKWNFSKREF